MAESTLSVQLAEIRTEVCDYLGLGRTYSSLSSTDAARVDASIKGGVSRVYFNDAAHRWSFLEPQASLSLVAADNDYDLPDDFGFMITPFTFNQAQYFGNQGIQLVGEGVFRQRQQLEFDYTGPPFLACITPKTTNGTNGQRFEVRFHPKPDTSYTLSYRYSILPDVLASAVVFPYGGAAYGQLFLQACLAEAEQRYNDSASTNHQARFQSMLAAAIERDRKTGHPSNLGYNGDGSNLDMGFRHLPYNLTINGNPV